MNNQCPWLFGHLPFYKQQIFIGDQDLYWHGTAAYNEVVHWKTNLFLILSGCPGKGFVSELARLLQAIADDGSSLEGIAMMACTILQALLLQNLSRNSKSKDHVTHSKKRLDLWQRVIFNHSLRKVDVFRNISRNLQDHLMMMMQ